MQVEMDVYSLVKKVLFLKTKLTNQFVVCIYVISSSIPFIYVSIYLFIQWLYLKLDDNWTGDFAKLMLNTETFFRKNHGKRTVSKLNLCMYVCNVHVYNVSIYFLL